jgi:hypothetical protein
VWGDDQPMNPRERPGVVAVLQERDQRRQIEMFARHDRGIMERVGPLHYVMRAAEQAEPEIAALLREGLEGRRVGLMHFVRGLRSNGPLRAGLSESAAADTVWAVTSPDVHRLLTVNCGWSGDQYEHWLADTLARLLLP